MGRIYNILFSTTRQWNCGDEFILFGILNLLSRGKIAFNPIVWNRNPEVRQFHSLNPLKRNFLVNPENDIVFYLLEVLRSVIRLNYLDNSWREDLDFSAIDYVVFAGSPEWYTRSNYLYKVISSQKKPFSLFGIGLSREVTLNKIKLFAPMLISALNWVDLITVRDKQTYYLFQEIARKFDFPEPYLLPCPALFCVEIGSEKRIKKVENIGLIYQSLNSPRGNAIGKSTYIVQKNIYHMLLKSLQAKYRFSIICHYVDEICDAQKEFGGDIPIHYSFDAKDYIEIYRKCDLVIGPRVHGIGLSASLGIPGIAFMHSKRSSAVSLFKGYELNINRDIKLIYTDLLQHIENIEANIFHINSELIEYKKSYFQKYREIIRKCVSLPF